MPKTTAVDPAVRSALASVEWDGEAARLTCGQLDRKVYTKVNDALESLGGKWNKKAQAHLFADNAASELESLIETGVFIRSADIRQLFGEFETPDVLADEVVGRLEFETGGTRILEPSAGSGQLIKAIHRAYGSGTQYFAIDAVEIQGKQHAALAALGCCVHIDDFLSLDGAIGGLATFHYVVMNPPFARQADVDHVLHAWKFLAKGGRLVAIMSPGWTFRSNKKSTDFKAFVETHGSWKANPEGSFAVMGTSVNSVMVVLDK